MFVAKTLFISFSHGFEKKLSNCEGCLIHKVILYM